jgi:RNA polymerase sigma-70 factor (family 1)
MQGKNLADDHELVLKVAEGNEISFAALFSKYSHGLGAYIYGITKDKEIAEEIVLDVFLKIWMTREALAEIKNFKAYLFTLSRNAAISSLRKTIRNRQKHLDWKKSNVENGEEENSKEQILSVIDQAINNLSPQRKKIFLLSREKGMKYHEIAEMEGLSKLTVRAHIQQAVASINQYVRQRFVSGFIISILLLHLF